MIKWLRELFGLCDHKWSIIHKGNRTMDSQVFGHYYDCRCERCGKIRCFNT